MGCPSSSSLFNKTIDTMLDGSGHFPIPRYFAIHLETSRFSNRVSRIMCASLEEAQGVSHHLVAQMEDEYTMVQRTLYPDNSGNPPSVFTKNPLADPAPQIWTT
jgi:hypothetical protein